MSENRYCRRLTRAILDGMMDDEHCYRVASSRDGRFDGTFVTAVRTTGIYCRPSCPAMTPKRQNVRFYPTPAAAQEAGFRACKRCRPDAAPGSPEWDARADLVARAVRLIGDGVVEREGVGGLSERLGYSTRQMHRLLTTELGTGPLRLAMAHRVQNARALLENTDLPVTDVAWAAGFGSVRQFNDRVREVFASTPSQIRLRAGRTAPGADRPGGPGLPGRPGVQTVVAHLTYRPPLDLTDLLDFLGRRAVPGVEAWDGSTFERSLDLPHGPGLLALSVTETGPSVRRTSHPAVTATFRLADIRDYAVAVARTRRLLDLDADPVAVGVVLGRDPLLADAVEASPGRRMPGTVAPFELAVRAVVGQQVSLASARAVCGRLASAHGSLLGLEPVSAAGAAVGPHFLFPRPDVLAQADPGTLPLPGRRAATVVALAGAVADGRLGLDPGADRDETERRLLELPGIGPWTASYIRMRALGDPDVFLPADLVLDRFLAVGRALVRSAPAGPLEWKPWRSYAVAHLWAAARPELGGPPTGRGEGTSRDDTRGEK
jgi:AraC family transcriptional regulator of adaptative response / DNA-3-methyladenine glycosylase II